jgi:hypothetical protein
MYAEYEHQTNQEHLLYEAAERTSDIQLPGALNILLLTIWAVICLIGFAIIFLTKNTVAGIFIIGVPTVVGMIIKPTFALCVMMLVLPTGAGLGLGEVFSLDRGVGIAVAASFVLNLLITRPRLQVGNKALWVLVIYTIWISLVSLTGPYLSLELERGFTQIQQLALVFIVYWILETNGVKSFHWALRSYIIGTMGTIALTFITGAAMRSVEEAGAEGRYAATLGQTIDANMLAALTAMAFLAAMYLFARDKNLLWRVVYLVAIAVLPIMLLRIGSRGALIALAFTLLSPFLFVRQVLRRPALALLLLAVVLVASVSAGLMVRERGLEASVAKRLTDIGLAEQAVSYRMMPIRQAIRAVTVRPTGTSYYGWFEQSGLRILPHSDFFLALGVYGIPGGALFALFVVLMMFTVKRIPLGLEKLYTRAVLTYLLVMGLNIGQLFQKHFWIFLAFIIAIERIHKSLVTATDELSPHAEYEEDLSAQHQLT